MGSFTRVRQHLRSVCPGIEVDAVMTFFGALPSSPLCQVFFRQRFRSEAGEFSLEVEDAAKHPQDGEGELAVQRLSSNFVIVLLSLASQTWTCREVVSIGESRTKSMEPPAWQPCLAFAGLLCRGRRLRGRVLCQFVVELLQARHDVGMLGGDVVLLAGVGLQVE